MKGKFMMEVRRGIRSLIYVRLAGRLNFSSDAYGGQPRPIRGIGRAKYKFSINLIVEIRRGWKLRLKLEFFVTRLRVAAWEVLNGVRGRCAKMGRWCLMEGRGGFIFDFRLKKARNGTFRG
jgi:hypothetical protein